MTDDARREVAVVVNRMTRLIDDLPDDAKTVSELDEMRGLLVDALESSSGLEPAHNTRVKLKRGSGTRDEDEWRFESSGATPSGAVEALEEQIAEADDLMGEIRGFDPGDD